MSPDKHGKRQEIWDKAGMTLTAYRDLPWPQKKVLILRFGPIPEQLAARTTIERVLMPPDVRGIVYKKEEK